MSANRAAREIMRALAGAGGWMGRPALDAGLSWSSARIDDELADLVAAGAVLFNPRAAAYCLAGSPLARRALQRLVQRPAHHHRELLMSPSSDGQTMRVAVALQRPVPPTPDEPAPLPELVMCEVQLPAARQLEQHLAQVQAVIATLGEPVAAP